MDVWSRFAAQRPGWSLEQPFYTDPTIFELERQLWFPRQWMLMGHVAELPRKGAHIVRSLFNEEVLIVRAGEDDFRAFFNVCTHRGSRICKSDGHANLLVCPYHAWSFRLTGELQSRGEVPEGIDPDALGLHPVPIRVREGVIFCGLDAERLPDPTAALDAITPALQHHGIARTRVLERRSYPTRANWKLVMENFLECYHCRPAHPEYTSVNGHVAVLGARDPDRVAQYQQEVAAWLASCPDKAFNTKIWDPGGIEATAYGVSRTPLGDGRLTQSQDGRPVAPLMGSFAEYDGGETAIRFGRLSFVGGLNDHAILFQIIPRAVDLTDTVMTWLVDASATDIDVERVCWLWEATTSQDKGIVEENAAGVRSGAYRPGPYTDLEPWSAWFIANYLKEMSELAPAAV
jgi:Rieske 2Fe-2S family protein